MRRALLTTGKAAGLTVGNSTDANAGNNTAAVVWDNFNPAASSGVLNTVTLQSNASAADYAIFTINSSGVITDISATITTDLVAGTNTIALASPLSVNAGDFIGAWFNGSPAVRYATASTGFGRRYKVTPIAKPTVGATLTTDSILADTHWLISGAT